jgi:uncharacterized protein (DUF924 family)
MPTPQEVLRFWFEETPPSAWFRPGPDRDRIVRERFGALTDQALAGERAAWGESAVDALALLLVLDQFPRQIWRDQPRAFAGDGQALALTLRAVAAGWVAAEPARERRPFWLMPLMHSEDPAVQELGLPLFERHTDARTAEFARRHHAVIARFGRFPHRNRILGRPSSPEEQAFLQQPGSRF